MAACSGRNRYSDNLGLGLGLDVTQDMTSWDENITGTAAVGIAAVSSLFPVWGATVLSSLLAGARGCGNDWYTESWK